MNEHLRVTTPCRSVRCWCFGVSCCLHFQGLNFSLKGDRIVKLIIYWRNYWLNRQRNEHFHWRHCVKVDCTADVSEIRAVSIFNDIRNACKYSPSFQDAMTKNRISSSTEFTWNPEVNGLRTKAFSSILGIGYVTEVCNVRDIALNIP